MLKPPRRMGVAMTLLWTNISQGVSVSPMDYAIAARAAATVDSTCREPPLLLLLLLQHAFDDNVGGGTLIAVHLKSMPGKTRWSHMIKLLLPGLGCSRFLSNEQDRRPLRTTNNDDISNKNNYFEITNGEKRESRSINSLPYCPISSSHSTPLVCHGRLISIEGGLTGRIMPITLILLVLFPLLKRLYVQRMQVFNGLLSSFFNKQFMTWTTTFQAQEPQDRWWRSIRTWGRRGSCGWLLCRPTCQNKTYGSLLRLPSFSSFDPRQDKKSTGSKYPQIFTPEFRSLLWPVMMSVASGLHSTNISVTVINVGKHQMLSDVAMDGPSLP